MDQSNSTDSQHQPYVYRPLEGPNWIRILQLHPASCTEHSLTCQIVHLNREELDISTDKLLNYYFAVSYVWGQWTFDRELVCEDTHQPFIVKITSNVDFLLRRFRKKDKAVNLWVDAICLNQSDLVEIGQQVPLMGSIYRQARKVLVWMGYEHTAVAKVFAFFRILLKIEDHTIREDTGQEMLSKALSDVFNSESTQPIERFFQIPWFKRRWVLQELASSIDANIYCEDEKISRNLLVSALDKLTTFQDVLAEDQLFDHTTQQALRTVRLLRYKISPLLENMWEFHGHECFDPRDKIFALLGFSKPDKEIEVNYSIEADEMYSRFAAKYMRNRHLHSILKHAFGFGSLSAKKRGLPSWCPDWSKSRPQDPHDIFRFDVMLSLSNCSMRPEGCIDTSEDCQKIFLRYPTIYIKSCTGQWPPSFTWKNITIATLNLWGDLSLFKIDIISILFDLICKLGNFTTSDTAFIDENYARLRLLLQCEFIDTFNATPIPKYWPSYHPYDKRDPYGQKVDHERISKELAEFSTTSEEEEDFFAGRFRESFLKLMEKHNIVLARCAVAYENVDLLGFGPEAVLPGDIILPGARTWSGQDDQYSNAIVVLRDLSPRILQLVDEDGYTLRFHRYIRESDAGKTFKPSFTVYLEEFEDTWNIDNTPTSKERAQMKKKDWHWNDDNVKTVDMTRFLGFVYMNIDTARRFSNIYKQIGQKILSDIIII